MAFLNPLLLFGITAVSIPIILHILNKRQFDRVVWGAMRFLQISIEKNQRRLQIEDLLLLICRCLLLILLALALARPAIRGAGAGGFFGQSKSTAVLVLDNSYSMCQTNGVSSRFDRAKDALIQAIDTMPSGSSVAVILGSDVADAVIPEPTYDLQLARKTIHDAKLCDRSTNLLRSFTDGIDILHKKGGVRNELFVATDGQFSAFAQINEICKALDDAKGDVSTHILLTGEHETQNLGVSDLKMGSDIPAVGVLHAFDVEVSNFGEEDASAVKVQLATDDEAPSAEAIIDRIPVGQARSITLSAKLRTDGYHSITASIQPDRLAADDHRTVAIRALSKVNVLLVDGNPGNEPRDSEVFFLRHAMVPVARAQADQYLVKATTVLAADLESAKLENYQVIALADVSDLSDRTMDDLAAFVRRGGGLLIFPGDNTQPVFYNQKMLGKYGLLPAEMGETKGDATQQVKFDHLAGRPLDHPIVSVWGDPEAGDLASAHFFKHYLLKPTPRPAGPAGVDAGDARVVLSFSDGSPYLVERPFGQGKVILFASTASARWNNLPDHAGIFVPLLYRTMGWILLQQNQQLNVKVGDKFVFHPPLELLGQEATITRPQASGGPTHDSRRVEMDARNVPTLTYDDTGIAGSYEVVLGNDKPIKFATQADKAESSLEDIGTGQRKQLAGSAVVLDWKPGLDLKAIVARERVGTELWLPIAVIALMLGTAETFLADWFSQSR